MQAGICFALLLLRLTDRSVLRKDGASIWGEFFVVERRAFAPTERVSNQEINYAV